MVSPHILLYALLGGILPALLWLWFWLKEDNARPEPRGLILLAFIAGMLTVPLVLPFQKLAATMLGATSVIIAWAAVEELFKYVVAYFAVLRKKDMDEPIDAVIYMITVALGFAALENTFFLLNPLSDGNITGTILTGNLRFLGAMLLHVLSSATIGIAIALSFSKNISVRRLFIGAGVILSIVLHTLFNLFIINSNGEKALIVFIFVWIGIILLILFFEKLKRMKINRMR